MRRHLLLPLPTLDSLVLSHLSRPRFPLSRSFFFVPEPRKVGAGQEVALGDFKVTFYRG